MSLKGEVTAYEGVCNGSKSITSYTAGSQTFYKHLPNLSVFLNAKTVGKADALHRLYQRESVSSDSDCSSTVRRISKARM